MTGKVVLINTLDTFIGTALYEEFVGPGPEPENEIYGTWHSRDDSFKPTFVKKMMKRSKPVLFRKYMREKMDTFIFDLHSGRLDDLKWAVWALTNEPLESEKTLIVISSVLSWGGNEHKMIEVKEIKKNIYKKEKKEEIEEEEEKEEEEEVHHEQEQGQNDQKTDEKKEEEEKEKEDLKELKEDKDNKIENKMEIEKEKEKEIVNYEDEEINIFNNNENENDEIMEEIEEEEINIINLNKIEEVKNTSNIKNKNEKQKQELNDINNKEINNNNKEITKEKKYDIEIYNIKENTTYREFIQDFTQKFQN